MIHGCALASGWAGIVAALGRAAAGDRIELESGRYEGVGTLKVPSGVALVAMGEATLVNTRESAVLLVAGTNVDVSGVRIIAAVAGQAMVVIVDAEDIRIAE